MDKNQKILNFLKRKELMVISTINENGSPESAVVGFSETPEFEIIFGTFNDTRKYRNLKVNKKVSVVFGWELEEKITVQYEGEAEELSGSEMERCRSLHIAKNPKREKHAFHEKERIFKIKPKWIRYSKLEGEEEIFEVDFSIGKSSNIL